MIEQRINEAKTEFDKYMKGIAQKTGLSVSTLVERGIFQIDRYFKNEDEENIFHLIAVVCRLLIMDINDIAKRSGRTPLEIYEEFWKE